MRRTLIQQAERCGAYGGGVEQPCRTDGREKCMCYGNLQYVERSLLVSTGCLWYASGEQGLLVALMREKRCTGYGILQSVQRFLLLTAGCVWYTSGEQGVPVALMGEKIACATVACNLCRVFLSVMASCLWCTSREQGVLVALMREKNVRAMVFCNLWSVFYESRLVAYGIHPASKGSFSTYGRQKCISYGI